MKAAIIGCGRMGAECSSRLVGHIPASWLPVSHAESLKLIKEVELVALCDVDEKLLKQRGQQYHVSSLFTDYQTLIDDIQPDILTIATRTPVKCEIIEYACQKGVKGIYVEKPIANSLEELTNTLACVRRYGVKLVYGVNRRYHPMYRHAKKLIAEGIIGEIVEITAEHGQAQLFWSHPHTTDLFLFFTGTTDLTHLQARLVANSVNQTSNFVIDSDPLIENAFFKFASGITATIVKSNGLNLRISGARGNLVIHADGSFIQVNQSNQMSGGYFLDQKIINLLPTQSGTVIALSELMKAIKDNSEPPISLKEIEIGTQMLMGCVWSHLNEGRIIQPNTIPHQLVITGRYNNVYA